MTEKLSVGQTLILNFNNRNLFCSKDAHINKKIFCEIKLTENVRKFSVKDFTENFLLEDSTENFLWEILWIYTEDFLWRFTENGKSVKWKQQTFFC